MMKCQVCGVVGKRGHKPGIHKTCLQAAIMAMQISEEPTMKEDEPSEDTGEWELPVPWFEEDVLTEIKVRSVR